MKVMVPIINRAFQKFKNILNNAEKVISNKQAFEQNKTKQSLNYFHASLFYFLLYSNKCMHINLK